MGSVFLSDHPLGKVGGPNLPHAPMPLVGTATFLTPSIAVADKIEQIGTSLGRLSQSGDASYFVQCALAQKKAPAIGTRAKGG